MSLVAKEEVLKLEGNFNAPLSKEIQKEYNKMATLVAQVPKSQRTKKSINFTGGNVSVCDLVSYQIGWGRLVVQWYNEGVKGKMPQMPGDGFTTWDYTGLAKHFFANYGFDAGQKQDAEFHKIASKITEIVEKEHKTGNLDQPGVWEWCKLQSGKAWALSKWAKINTASPYKRASALIRAFLK